MKIIDKFRALVPTKKKIQEMEKTNPGTLLELAISKGMKMDKLSQLLDIYQKWEAGKAKKRYFEALSNFQAECPRIRKNKVIKNKDGSIRYKYADLNSIVEQIREHLINNGLSFSMKYKPSEKTKIIQEYNPYSKKTIERTLYYIFVICEIHHIDGHTEPTEMEVPIDISPYMSNIQQIGSTHTYGNRYTLCGALGITTADQDDDGNSYEQIQRDRNVEDAHIVYPADENKGGKEKTTKQKGFEGLRSFVTINQKKLIAKKIMPSSLFSEAKGKTDEEIDAIINRTRKEIE